MVENQEDREYLCNSLKEELKILKCEKEIKVEEKNQLKML
jgi:hypothetical protein